jgi:hypothetical protein
MTATSAFQVLVVTNRSLFPFRYSTSFSFALVAEVTVSFQSGKSRRIAAPMAWALKCRLVPGKNPPITRLTSPFCASAA